MINKKLSQNDEIIGSRKLTVGDFWSWAYSDILSNRNRAIYAEFLVGSSLDVVNIPKIEWDGVDLLYKGRKIEVKSSAFIQSWKQRKLSPIRFDISKKKAWYAEDNTFETEPVRAADCYVFCLYAETDESKVNVLDIRDWQFYVLSTEEIESELGNQKSVGIKRIKTMCNYVDYKSLKDCIDQVLKLE